ncbi:hypothetical protein HPB51_011604 [Rhipicephalus microplus]|uniref:SWIM-type domain-containing protein n=1 Tax=Rhipicephalus microplus TaxID=6941 RepID=A0A9J6E904_RHIMP|nr:hypothetical protein HPB51_011604 [Rhipicephalus microplus]
MLKGTKNKRVDKIISAVMDLTYNFLMKSAMQMIKGANAKKFTAIERYHRSGTEIVGCAELNEDSMWAGPSQSTKGHSYTVTKGMDDACCPLRCKECAVCVHTYRCTCYAHLIHFTVCKHIHCVVIANTPSSSDNNDYESPPETASEMSELLHILESITKLDAPTRVSSASLFKAKMEFVKQAIVDVQVSEEVGKKANKFFQASLAAC